MVSGKIQFLKERIDFCTEPFSVRIFYREPYHSKNRNVFRFFTKSANCTRKTILVETRVERFKNSLFIFNAK